MVRHFIYDISTVYLLVINKNVVNNTWSVISYNSCRFQDTGSEKIRVHQVWKFTDLEFFSYLRKLYLKSPVTTVTLLLLVILSVFLLVLIKTSYQNSFLDVFRILLLKYQVFFHLEVQSNYIETHYLHQNKLFQDLFQA